MERNSYPQMPVLLVDDEKNALRSYELALQSAGIHNIIKCENAVDALAKLKSKEIELIVMDMIMPGMNGMELLSIVNAEYPHVPVIMATCVNDLSNAVECMQNGAVDYLVKPVDMEKLISQVKNILQISQLKRENKLLRNSLMLDSDSDRPKEFADIITNNKYMLSIFQYCTSVSKSNQPILITGETGVGKELFARALHQLSMRPGELVSLNIAGFDDGMLADALFGHTKGAFTGAINSRPGMLEKASNGTLFIDEIGDLNTASQVKLLRLLQEREYTPLGSDSHKHSSARVILATLRDLHELQRDKLFRKDLYYRISTHHIHIPPLRERKDDIPLLLDHLLVKISKEMSKKVPQYPNELIAMLKNYHFPGNIRELESMVYDAVSNHQSRLLSTRVFSDHIKRNSHNAGLLVENFTSLEDCLPNLEVLPKLKPACSLIVKEALRRAEENQSLAAKMLGITPQALNSRLKKM